MTPLKIFQKWLIENEATVLDLNIKVRQNGEREVVSKQIISPNRNIVKIPKKLIITELHGMNTDYGKLLLNGDYSKINNLGISLVAIYILTTFNKDCFFQPYYDILPDNLDNFPIFWNKVELSHLQGSNILNKITERVESFINDYNIIAMNCTGFKEQHPLKHFIYIRTLIGSRNFGINIDGKKCVAMVPFADMLNHNKSPDTRWYYCPTINAFKMDSQKKIQRGCEVTDTYGNKCNSKYLIFYGFAIPNNDENAVHVELVHCRDESNIIKRNICENFDGNLMNKIDTAFFKLMCFLRVSAGTKTELLENPDISSYETPLNKSNEIKALKNLHKLIYNIEANYIKPYKELVKDLRNLKPYTNKHTAITFIIGEINILLFYKNLAEEFIEKLNGSNKKTNTKYQIYQKIVKHIME